MMWARGILDQRERRSDVQKRASCKCKSPSDFVARSMKRRLASSPAMFKSAGNSRLQSPNKSMARKSRGAKFAHLFVMMMLGVTLSGFIWEGSADGECGSTLIRTAFINLNPCMVAARDAKAKVSHTCCERVKSLMQSNPRCLYAVFHSPEARFVGVVPAVAMSIPKRCNIGNISARRNV
ncbi:non-specific lipid transfer protein GPI-anchored 19 [Eucalyptus grandis]|uniref:non-specific lipid transfer protein GPI-anchored 19 n=1 Tax=Eucalyptus grandis TaxID=71139 RepID=UPI00192EEFDA|nr:non-specific lipid transfer protein GPI-anchored 19 [Eucalyptus grandis]